MSLDADLPLTRGGDFALELPMELRIYMQITFPSALYHCLAWEPESYRMYESACWLTVYDGHGAVVTEVEVHVGGGARTHFSCFFFPGHWQ
jgi:hypothetical protein